MVGYMSLIAPCFACGTLFTSNPERVPSYQNNPICKACITIVNENRKANGLPTWPVLDGAYEPASESPWDDLG